MTRKGVVMRKHIETQWIAVILLLLTTNAAHAWYDETHVAIAKAAGYPKWFNAAAADIARVKQRTEGYNHFVNNPRGSVITPAMVLDQADLYDTRNPKGHLYGAIIGSFRAYQALKASGRYAEGQMAYLAHYVGDLSMPLHNTVYNAFNKKFHAANDGLINAQVLDNIGKIKIYPITIRSEADLAAQVARIANLSITLGYLLEDQNRLMTEAEAYRQVGHSASLLKAVLDYLNRI
jgi:hypothetical protein